LIFKKKFSFLVKIYFVKHYFILFLSGKEFFVKKKKYVKKNPGVWKRNLALRKRNWALKKKKLYP
jgi:hypothetical protein